MHESVDPPREVRIPIAHDSDIVVARREARAFAARIGLPSHEQALVATAVSEITRNIVVYAKAGEIVVSLVERAGKRGVHFVATDRGPGIPDLGLAMQDGYSTGKGLGLGLPGAKRLMDDFEVVSQPGAGTTVTMTKWTR